ncbi:hypothetical protein DAPPUDRAFT_232034 [Daphnia pulex]|uniref:Uncharacterized protein n=1 Tax=Daphnia pulex TaxID=6669 RepID=E9FRS2_DAPPU|nr:hypothetical protein DAPPUDRAFT_232034 [Daphnia pulex]|eukprot:EFX90433.1 hypothetical protein DAPPUDRAFT_232034 [Daphnia pulex]
MSKHRVVHPLRRTLSHPSLADSISDGWNNSSMDGSESAAEHFVDNRSSSSRCSARPRRETVASALSESISNTTSNHAHRGNQSNPSAVETICKSTAFNALPAVTLSNETSDRKKSLKPRFDYMILLFLSLFIRFPIVECGKDFELLVATTKATETVQNLETKKAQ